MKDDFSSNKGIFQQPESSVCEYSLGESFWIEGCHTLQQKEASIAKKVKNLIKNRVLSWRKYREFEIFNDLWLPPLI